MASVRRFLLNRVTNLWHEIIVQESELFAEQNIQNSRIIVLFTKYKHKNLYRYLNLVNDKVVNDWTDLFWVQIISRETYCVFFRILDYRKI